MPVKHHPQVPFVRRVPTWKMHLFTFVQILALAMLWAVKSSPFSLAFPFFLIMMVPIRKQLESIFSPLELRALSFISLPQGPEITKITLLYLVTFSSMEANRTKAQRMSPISTSRLPSLLKDNGGILRNLRRTEPTFELLAQTQTA